MSTTVSVDDYTLDLHYYLVFDAKEKSEIDSRWHDEDKLLVDLSSTQFFEGHTRWNELRPIHYKFLILRNLDCLVELTEAERLDSNQPTNLSLKYLIGFFINCLNERADTMIEFLKIQRISDKLINFDYHASLALEWGGIIATEPGLKVVVDNTKCPE